MNQVVKTRSPLTQLLRRITIGLLMGMLGVISIIFPWLRVPIYVLVSVVIALYTGWKYGKGIVTPGFTKSDKLNALIDYLVVWGVFNAFYWYLQYGPRHFR